MPHEGIASLCLELSMLLHAGVDIGDGLSLMAEESTPENKKMLAQMSQQSYEGEPLSGILQKPGRFPAYVCGLVEVGEQSGRVEEALASPKRGTFTFLPAPSQRTRPCKWRCAFPGINGRYCAGRPCTLAIGTPRTASKSETADKCGSAGKALKFSTQ